MLTPEETAKIHENKDDCYYMPYSIGDDIRRFKLARYEYIKPDVITLASSRGLQIKGKFFKDTTKYYNMSYVAGSLNELITIFDKMLEIHKPKLIVLGLDFWWFNDVYQKPMSIEDHKIFFPEQKKLTDIGFLLSPLKWLFQNRIDISDLKYLFQKSFPNECKFGYRGINSHAIMSDGSFSYARIMRGYEKNHDYKFLKTTHRIKVGDSRFSHLSTANDFHISNLLHFLQKLKNLNIETIIFLPPMSPAMTDLMKDYDYKYIDDLKQKLRANNISFYDFHNPKKSLKTSDCEFIDGFHGGDTLYAKIIRYMAQKSRILGNIVDLKYLNYVIKEYDGFPEIGTKYSYLGFKQCNKEE